jgi:hypothetical protein
MIMTQMTPDQMKKISIRAIAYCNAKPYREPTLDNGNWTVGFWPTPNAPIALQVTFLDREVSDEKAEYKATAELESAIRGALLMSA